VSATLARHQYCARFRSEQVPRPRLRHHGALSQYHKFRPNWKNSSRPDHDPKLQILEIVITTFTIRTVDSRRRSVSSGPSPLDSVRTKIPLPSRQRLSRLSQDSFHSQFSTNSARIRDRIIVEMIMLHSRKESLDRQTKNRN
jgi:hypothetical protein